MKKKTYPLYYGKEKQHFARSVVVGGLVFLSGMSGRTMETGNVSSADVKEQMLVALDKVRAALEEAGSDMDHIVKTVIYLKDVKDYALMRATEWEYWQEHAPGLIAEPPASTFVMPASLARENMLVEIDVVACLKE
ncbi:MAG: RidA family protein [Actinomycetia bacterium]|nr:RidA family protein [Actinomycetes bacterium]